MNYPAILTYEGARVLAGFPDCPGCRTFAGSESEILPLAQEAVESWLEASLERNEVPPKPSDLVRIPAKGKVLVVPVSSELATRLEAAWDLSDFQDE